MKSVKQKKAAANTHKSVKRGNESPISKFLYRHKVALIESLVRLLAAPYATAMAVMVMAIAIALAGSFYVLVSNSEQLVNSLQTGKQISLFLDEQISDQQASKLAEELRANELIDQVILITKQQALVEFKQYSGFGAALDALEGNPLPAVLQVYPKETLTEAYQLKQLLAQMQNEKSVEFAQMDMAWVTRLQSIIQIASRVVVLLSSLLALAVVFITGNTIRSELQTRQDEVIVSKLVGATNAFISQPFVYAGFWYGCMSGVLAWIIISSMLLMIRESLEQLSLLYQSQFQLHFLSMGESVLLVCATSLLGIIGAFAVVSHQLRLLKPE